MNRVLPFDTPSMLLKNFNIFSSSAIFPPNGVSWVLESGDLFKQNNGSWELKDMGNGKTQVTYLLSVEFNRFVPQMIINSLVSKQLPSMMQAFHERVRRNIK